MEKFLKDYMRGFKGFLSFVLPSGEFLGFVSAFILMLFGVGFFILLALRACS